MEQASDIAIWEYADAKDFVIASRDRDFLERSVLLGHPPKILQIRLGNCGVRAVADLPLRHRVVLGEFGVDPDKAYLLLP
jgi:predicted nuclease of predicted toxin-antitoxin system